jgi:hypothetical protein
MEFTGKSKTGEAGRKVVIARADAHTSQLALTVADILRDGIAMEFNKQGGPTATGKGREPAQVRRLTERLK